MERVAVDTSFLIDVQNERRGRGARQGGLAFLRANPGLRLALPVVALGEYLEGFPDPAAELAIGLVRGLEHLPITLATARLYASTARGLREAGRLIGTNDLWIGCIAKAAGLPILTRDVEPFRRIGGLDVIAYGP